MNKSDLEALVDIRVKEAKLLLDNNCYEGAYYLLDMLWSAQSKHALPNR